MCGGGFDYCGEGLLTEEVSRPFWWGEGIKDRKRNGELAKSEKNGFRSGLNAVF